MPAFVVNMLLAAWAAASGRPAYVTSAVAEIMGAPTRTFFRWAADHAAGFERNLDSEPTHDSQSFKKSFGAWLTEL